MRPPDDDTRLVGPQKTGPGITVPVDPQNDRVHEPRVTSFVVPGHTLRLNGNRNVTFAPPTASLAAETSPP
jgi:hypothetical protein